MQPTVTDRPDFESHRPRLFGIAYRMLGSVHDAEDVVQDAFVRWQRAEPAAFRSPEAWLVAVTTRLAIDRLRRATTERQAYVGDWLPEPLAIARDGSPPDGESASRLSELASDLSVAFLRQRQVADAGADIGDGAPQGCGQTHQRVDQRRRIRWTRVVHVRHAVEHPTGLIVEADLAPAEAHGGLS